MKITSPRADSKGLYFRFESDDGKYIVEEYHQFEDLARHGYDGNPNSVKLFIEARAAYREYDRLMREIQEDVPTNTLPANWNIRT